MSAFSGRNMALLYNAYQNKKQVIGEEPKIMTSPPKSLRFVVVENPYEKGLIYGGSGNAGTDNTTPNYPPWLEQQLRAKSPFRN